ncbi:MAG: cupin domain-containing protein [Treponemataceae bacterium]
MTNINTIEAKREILAQNEKFKVVYFNFDKDGGLPNHTHNGFATLQIIEGKASMQFLEGEKFILSQGDFFSFDARVKHNVTALEQCKVLVTISESLDKK